MLSVLLVAALLTQSPPAIPSAEPDGSRTLGVVPPYRGKPAPPVWLRVKSHHLAALDCRHYLYEVYGDVKGRWLVRYVSFPEEGEAFRSLEQAFLFSPEAGRKAEELQIAAVQYEPTLALYRGTSFVLVDRRDLLRP